jgi:hypothetical protein
MADESETTTPQIDVNPSQSSKDPALIPTSPYYLHPAENPAAVLVSPPMNGNNYDAWSKKMRRALLTKNKIKFINGKIVAPLEDDALFEAWERCNGTVVSWIASSLSPEIAQSIEHVDSAFDLWNELKNRFSKGDHFRMSDLLQEIHSMKQGEKTVNSFYTDLKVLWEDLEVLRPMPNCTCGATDCIRKQRETEYVICFLKGLGDQFNTVRTQILMMEPLPSISKVFSSVLQQERQIGGSLLGATPKILMAHTNGPSTTNQGRGGFQQSRGRGRHSYQGRGFNKGKVCTFCGKENHIVDDCYFKHGFPPGFKFKDKGPNVNNAAVESSVTEPELDTASPMAESDFKITPDMYKQLLALLDKGNTSGIGTSQVHHIQSSSSSPHMTQEVTGNRLTFPWIIDTGATHHICCSLDIFHTHFHIKPLEVKLPDGSYVSTQTSGTIMFSDSFILHDVLYIPQFSVNLLSAYKLSNSLKCKLIFDHNSCVIQEIPSLKMIGRARVKHNLYVLDQISTHIVAFTKNCDSFSSVFCNHTISNDFDLWHHRLGHPSHNVVQHLITQFPFVQSLSNKICDCCHFAKQHKLPFPRSYTKSIAAFDLIHMDIWGPLAIPSVHGHHYFLTVVDDFTRHTWLFLMKNKHETRTLVKNFVRLVHTQFSCKIKMIRSDNGSEFLMDPFYNEHGIVHQRSCVETPEQNAVVERKHRHIMNVIRALMFQGNLPKSFWCYAATHAVFLINRLPSKVINNKSPFETLHSQLLLL